MTELEKAKIDELKKIGYGYKKIASELFLSPNTVKSYLKRSSVSESEIDVQESICLFCGKQVKQNEHRKIKKFCSDKCRYDYWNKHRSKAYG